MSALYRTTIREIGPEAPDLLEGGMLILFEVGAPPELAEVSVLHQPDAAPSGAPAVGDRMSIGAASFAITAVGETAWKKVTDMGHVVLNFNGGSGQGRPGEIALDGAGADLAAAVMPGAIITFSKA